MAVDPFRVVDNSANITTLHPLVAVLTVIVIFIALTKERNAIMAAILVVMNFVTSAQRVSLAGIDFPIIRILICFILLRIILKREYIHFRLNGLDIAVIFQICFTAFVSILRYPAVSEMVYQVSTVLDALGGYYVVRLLIKDRADLRAATKALMWISIPIALIFIQEKMTGRNPMAIFGGVAPLTWVREGKMRVQGPYPHVILAGAFWASVIPLFWMYKSKNRAELLLKCAGYFGGFTVIILCASSTPIMSTMVGVGAIILYYQRNVLGRLKAVTVIGIIGLSLFWGMPIWYLVAKIDFTGGSTGFFRYYLIDCFVRHWKEWAVIGTRTTMHWGEGLVDVCNEYVSAGVNGGLIGFGAFIASIAIAFKYMGILVHNATDQQERREYWVIGVTILVHLFNFIGVSYFNQIIMSWWMSLAFCSSLYQRSLYPEVSPALPAAISSPGLRPASV